MHTKSISRVALVALAFVAATCMAQSKGFSWVQGYLQATVTYDEGGKRKRLRVLSEFTSFCMWETAQPRTLTQEFEATVSSEYSKHLGASVSSVGYVPASVLEYQHTLLAKQGHDEIVTNGFTNTSYTSKCK